MNKTDENKNLLENKRQKNNRKERGGNDSGNIITRKMIIAWNESMGA